MRTLLVLLALCVSSLACDCSFIVAWKEQPGVSGYKIRYMDKTYDVGLAQLYEAHDLPYGDTEFVISTYDVNGEESPPFYKYTYHRSPQ